MYFYNFEEDLKLTDVIVGFNSKVDILDIKRRLYKYNREIQIYDAKKSATEFKIEKTLIDFDTL